MAYNVIKGNIEFSGDTQGTIEDMVDDHSDQTIGGIKTFSQILTASSGLSASFFYGDGTNLTGITEPAIVTYDGAATNRLIVGSYNSNVVSGAVGLSYDGSSLSVTGDVTASVNVSASAFQGDGNALTNIGATSLNLGQGIENDGSNNIRVKLDSAPAIARGAGGIKVDLSSLATMTSGDLQTSDTMLVSDGGVNKSITMANLTTYFDNTIADTSPAGSNRQLQFNDDGDFGASANLTFNSSTNIFETVTASFTGDVDVQGNTTMSGTLKVNVDRDGTPLITLDKGESDTAEIEFKNNGITVGEIYSNAGESLFIRSVSLGINLRQGTDNVLNIDGTDATFAHRPVTINQDLTVTGSTIMSSSVTIVTNSTDATPHLHIHENDTEYGRISFTNNADTSGSITGYSHEWTLAASSSASGSQTNARFNIFYGDAQGDGNGLDLLGMNGIGDTAIKGTLALNCYQEDGTTSKVDPSTLVGHAHIYSKLVTGHAEMFVRDSNGNVTQISPHNPEGEWQYFSKNTRTGKVVRVNMEKMIRKLEQITGESFMEEWYEDPTD